MSILDWIVLICATACIIVYGIWKTRKHQSIDAYLMGDHAAKWWTIGLSVMATQASAITFLSTPGQAYDDGMRFVQFYFGLPIAMVIICIFFIPRYVNMKVFTVYEFLEKRFDLKTRLFAAFLFLIQRGLGAAITIFAPAIIFSSILGWNLSLTILLIGAAVTLYTAIGGTKAVSASHQLQMAVMIGGLFIAFFITLHGLPRQLGFWDALHVAGMHDKLKLVDFNVDWDNRYTFWSGITGGTFLALAYFGTDQSQAQRYISGQNIRESRLGLLFNAIFKIPMQFFILLTGVMVFVFYQFQPSPVFFNSHIEKEVLTSPGATEYAQLQREWNQEQENRKLIYQPYLDNKTNLPDKDMLSKSMSKERSLRTEAKTIIQANLPDAEVNDKDYVFIRFILDYLPHGIIGLLITAILAAGMSSTASELNALGSTTSVDFYKRLIRHNASDAHYVKMARWFTIGWGIVAILLANVGSLFENLIQFVNIVGSLFYGTILGIFLSAFLLPKMHRHGVFISAILAEGIVLLCYLTTDLGFLWYNVLGCVLVMIPGLLMSMLFRTLEKSIRE